MPSKPTWVPFTTEGTPSDEDTESVHAPPFSPLSGPSTNNDREGSDNGTCSVIDQEDEYLISTQFEQQQQSGIEEHNPEAEVTEDLSNNWCGFKIVGDNIDKNVCRSFQRVDMQTQSMHHFHCYAIRDRVDLSASSDCPPVQPDIDVTTLLPSLSDLTRVQQDCEVLVAR